MTNKAKRTKYQTDQLRTSRSATYAAWIAATAACLSCLISILVFMSYTKEKEKRDEERIEVIIERELNLPVSLTSENFYPGKFIPIIMRITLVNNSDRDITIIDPKIDIVSFWGPNGEMPRFLGPVVYEGFFYDIDNRIEQPINIPKGNGFRFYSKIRFPIANKASELIDAHYGKDAKVTTGEIIEFLRSKGMDLNGNDPLDTPSESWEGKIFQFIFTSGKGNKITKTISWDTGDKIMKGSTPDWFKKFINDS